MVDHNDKMRYGDNIFIQRKLEGLVRWLLVRFLSGHLPLYIVNEYPKSGGTWLGQMLGEALNLPFPRNCMPQLKPSIMHNHYLYPWGMKNIVVLFRDGRDVAVSWYYHCLYYNDRNNARLVNIVRKDLSFRDYDNITENLPEFIDYMFTRQKHPSFSWAQFVRHWHGRSGVVCCRYEDLRANAVGEIQRIVSELAGRHLDDAMARHVVEHFSFSKQAERMPGDENRGSFMRKGLVGDWINSFNRQSREAFDYYAGEELIRLGYEDDRSWIIRD